MVKVKIINGTIIRGVGHASPGEIHELDVKTARDLFIAGKAVPAEDEIRKPTTRKKPTTKRAAKPKPKTAAKKDADK